MEEYFRSESAFCPLSYFQVLFSLYPVPHVGIRRRALLGRYIGQRGQVARTKQPTLDVQFVSRADPRGWAFRLAETAVNAFVEMDDKKVLRSRKHETGFSRRQTSAMSMLPRFRVCDIPSCKYLRRRLKVGC